MKSTKNINRPKFRKKEFEIKFLSDGASAPEKAVNGSIGYDLCVPSDFHVPAHSRVAVPLDIAINFPRGIEGKIEPRSGCSLRGMEGYGTRKVRAGKFLGVFPRKKTISGKQYFDADILVGKIDLSYTDNIHVILNNRDEAFLIRKGTRIAQLTFYQTIAPFFKEVEQLTCKSRGGGLGHTGTDRLRGSRLAISNRVLEDYPEPAVCREYVPASERLRAILSRRKKAEVAQSNPEHTHVPTSEVEDNIPDDTEEETDYTVFDDMAVSDLAEQEIEDNAPDTSIDNNEAEHTDTDSDNYGVHV